MERNGRFAGFFAKERIWAPAATVDGDDGETDCGSEDEQTANDDKRRLCFEDEASFIALHSSYRYLQQGNCAIH